MTWWRRRSAKVPALEDIAVTSRQVLEGAPVVLVARLFTAPVQLVDVGTKHEDDIRAVHLGDLVAMDPTLAVALEMDRGDLLVRGGPSGAWERHLFSSDADFDRMMDDLGD